MFELVIPAIENEYWDEKKQEFVYVEHSHEVTLKLEHSLVSLSKWESIWEKPFLKKETKTFEESLSYIKCMTVTQNVPDEVYNRISPEQMSEIWKYIEKPMTASTVKDTNGKRSNKPITAEVIYYWMIALNIPVEFQKWHLNKLLMLIRVCDSMNTPPKKLTKKELYSRNNALNNARRAASHSKG